MTDRELLEAAAKAAGYDDAVFQDMEGWGEVRYGFSSAIWSEKLHQQERSGYWNPLEDDAHALRLAVKLEIQAGYSQFSGEGVALWDRGDRQAREYGPDDPYAATRRAIVRAAASMSGVPA